MTVLPGDGHVHSEWSWDARHGAMEATCARAVELGLGSVAFTEHLDLTPWTLSPEELSPREHLASLAGPDGRLTPPRLDVTGYLAGIARCRDLFPQLRILSGIEAGEPHRHAAAVAEVLGAGTFDRVLGSLHCLPDGDGFVEPPSLYRRLPAPDVVRTYLAEVTRLVSGDAPFEVLAHIDYVARYWPERSGPFDPDRFEDAFREALHALARSGRALEVNTRRRPYPQLVRWGREEGGRTLTFGSDAHDPDAVAKGFTDAAGLAEACGFRPGGRPEDPWTCAGPPT
jgi:histidinol-phosphatase (PHP family)